ncbi:MAG: creatininase family protein [Fimbriimonadaceae bacterium]|nr:creatininase family protein [Fimbriimonadaceae bacterium]
MILRDMTWTDVRDLSRSLVVLIPTGSLEQHGPHLPLFTDSILVTAVAEGVERRLPEKVLLTPTLWLGASGHHLAFPGSLSASFEGYVAAVSAVVESLIPHGFHRFYVLNGHGGNTSPNDIAMRALKARHLEATFGHSGYFAFIPEDASARILEGPAKKMRHACEAETSMIQHLRPDLVRLDRRVDDGLTSEPAVQGVVHHFDECTENGVLGYATGSSPEKGKALLDLAFDGVTREIETIHDGYVLR